MERFERLYKDNIFYDRIKRGLELSADSNEKLFLKLEFENSRPIWSKDSLNIFLKNDLQKLCSNIKLIDEECKKV